MPPLTLIAARLTAHFQRMEADPEINRHRRFDKEAGAWVLLPVGERDGHAVFYMAGAHAAGSKVGVTYVSYQGRSLLTKADALAYLEWLDAGNNGTHRDWEKTK